MAGVCSKFGWCKPTNLAPVTKVRRMIFPNLANVDGADVSHQLALSQENIVDVCEGFSGTNYDEMSFSYLASIQNYAGTFTFTTSNNAGDLLFTQNLCPSDSSLLKSITDNGKTLYGYGTLPFISSYFQYYRGSLCLRLKFVKTEFHSGRIAVCFFPQVGATAFPSAYDDAAYINRLILDLRENNEVEIEVPYLSTMPYRNINDPYGFIKIFVVDPLVVPASVSTTISCIVEVVGAKDLEFAVPATNNLQVYTTTATQAGSFDPEEYVGMLKLGESSHDEVAAASSCIGEKIVSFRSLVKRPSIFSYYVATTPTAGDVIQVQQIPYQLNTNYYDGAAWQVFSRQDQLGVMSQCYALSRGSVRIKLVDEGGSTSLIQSVLYAPGGTHTGFAPGFGTTPASDLNTLSVSINNSVGQNNVMTVHRPDLTGGVEVQIPQYNMTHSRVVSQCCNPSNPAIYYNDTRMSAPNLMLLHNFSSASQGFVYRSGGDDFSLGYFVSVPILG